MHHYLVRLRLQSPTIKPNLSSYGLLAFPFPFPSSSHKSNPVFLIGKFYAKIELKLKSRNDYLDSKQKEINELAISNSHRVDHFINLLQEAWTHLESDLDNLQNFTNINVTGVSKIVKKWDKQTRSATKQLYLEQQAEIQPWFDSLGIANLADSVTNGVLTLNRIKQNLLADKFVPQSSIFNSSLTGPPQVSNTPQISFKEKLNNAPLVFQTMSDMALEPSHIGFIIKSINDRKIDLNWKDEISGRTILHAAAKAGILKIICAAIDLGASSSIVDAYDCLPIYYAVIEGHTNIVSHLLKADTKLLAFSQEFHLLKLASSLGNLETFNVLLNQQISKWSQQELILALFKCSETGNWEMAELLYNYGLDITTALNEMNQNALHISCIHGHYEMTKWLLNKGVPKNLKDKDSYWTPLFFAANEGYTSIVQLLLADTDNPEIYTVDDRGRTPVFYAAFNGHIECAQLLARINSEPSIQKNQTLDLDDDSMIPSLELPPPVIPLKVPKRFDTIDKTCIIIGFRSKLNSENSFINFVRNIRLEFLRLQISSISLEYSQTHTVQLPLQERTKTLIFDFPTNEEINFEFKLFPSFGSILIGKTIISGQFYKLETESNVKIPLLDSSMDVVAEILLDFMVISPLPVPLPKISSSINQFWRICEINSNKNSFNKYFSVNVQVTRDGVPIIFAPDTINHPNPGNKDSNISLNVQDLTFSVINSIVNRPKSFTKHLSSLSAKLVFDETPNSESTLWKHLLQESCLSLEGFIRDIPQDIGLAINIIPPTGASKQLSLNWYVDCILKAVFSSASDFYRSKINEFSAESDSGSFNNDALEAEGAFIEKEIVNKSKFINRPILFYSTSLSMCLLIQWKQPVYPVILNVNLRKNSESVSGVMQNNTWSDSSILSLKSACKKALGSELFGVMCDSPLLTMVPSLIDVVSEYNLFLVERVVEKGAILNSSGTGSLKQRTLPYYENKNLLPNVINNNTTSFHSAPLLSELKSDAHLYQNVLYLKTKIT
ncbi:hypothetical protein BB560_006663 [Smittium megazygosporum]|uniref:SPX domain-containing protein n=1 Tax=Smittium megazygosporum TaxID=133381 RepID=A0A2T9Y2K4_9FUNG|nr:hypothetical protein BB560_006663 [Smittium megazygosporum]